MLLFLGWGLGFPWYCWRAIRTKVVLEQRCALISDAKRTNGVLCWMARVQAMCSREEIYNFCAFVQLA